MRISKVCTNLRTCWMQRKSSFLEFLLHLSPQSRSNACLTVKETAAWVLKAEDLVCDNDALALIELESTKRLKTVLTQRKC